MKVGFIGTGTMGRMLVRSYFKFSAAQEAAIYVSNRSRPSLDALKRECPAINIRTNIEVAEECDLVFVCTGPENLTRVAAEISPALGDDKLLISISNGVSLDVLSALVRCRIVKIIPTVAHSVGRGICLIMNGPRAVSADREVVANFMRCMGKPAYIDPANSRAATNITGCGPAIIAAFCDILVRESAEFATDLPVATLETLAGETLIATAKMLEADSTFATILADASTGGGMTAVAVSTLNLNLPGTIRAMILATIARESVVRSSAIA